MAARGLHDEANRPSLDREGLAFAKRDENICSYTVQNAWRPCLGRLRKGQLNQVSFEFKTSLKRIPHGKMKSTPRHRVAFLEDATAAPAIEENPGGCAS